MIRTRYNVNQYKKISKKTPNNKTKLWEEILIYIIVKSKVV